MASKTIVTKKKTVSKKTAKVAAGKSAHRGAKKAKTPRKAKPSVSKPIAASRKRTSVRSAKPKRASKVKKPAAAVKRRGGSGRTNRRVAMVRRAASTPATGRKKSRSATVANLKKKPPVESSPSTVPNGSETPVAEPKLTAADLEYFRALLVEKRRELLGDMGSMENTAFPSDGHSSSPIHMADVGTDNFEQEFTLGLLESERQTLREIHEAIERIDNGTFGICVATGKPIGRARLEAKPWAKYCIEYARQIERGQTSRLMEANNHHEDGEEDDD